MARGSMIKRAASGGGKRQRGGRIGRKRFQQGGHTHEYTKNWTTYDGTYAGDGATIAMDHKHWIDTHDSQIANTGLYASSTHQTTGGRHYHNSGISSAGRMRRGGRVRRQMGGLGNNLPKPWNGQ